MSHNQAYQEFSRLLEKLNNEFLINTQDIDLPSLKTEFEKIKGFFQQTIALKEVEHSDEAIARRWQSLQTELYREFRLLNTDVLFLASSRQAQTLAQRQQIIKKRIETIAKYCEAICQLL